MQGIVWMFHSYFFKINEEYYISPRLNMAIFGLKIKNWQVNFNTHHSFVRITNKITKSIVYTYFTGYYF